MQDRLQPRALYELGRSIRRGQKRGDKALNVKIADGQETFCSIAEDATLQGIYLKLRLLAQVEGLASHLEESPDLLWPRIILTILRDLKALRSLQEPTGAF